MFFRKKGMTHANPVILYLGHKDYKGRSLEQILGWTDADLERTHDYIQVLFPTTERSGAVRGSPVLSFEMLRDINTNRLNVLRQIQLGLHSSLTRMLNFYGLELSGDVDSPEPFIFETGVQPYVNWRSEGNHNSRRISRIISCLRLFGLHLLANAFSMYLQQTLPNHSSRCYWGY